MSNDSSLTRWLARLWPLWAAVVLVAFYATHGDPVTLLVRVVPGVTFAALLVGGIVGCGRLVLRRLGAGAGDVLLELPLSLAVGGVFTALVVFLTGIVGLWSPMILRAIAMLIGVIGWANLIRDPDWVFGLRTCATDLAAEHGLSRVLFFSVVAAACCIGILSLVPSFHYDALVDHLAIPHYWLLSGGIVPMPDNLLSFLPKQTEMLYALCLAVGDDLSANLVHAAMGYGATMALYGLGKRLGGVATGSAAAFGFLVAHKVILTASVAMVDVALAFYAIVLLAFLSSEDGQRGAWFFMVVGLLAGGCAATKYMGIPVAALALVSVAIHPSGRLGKRFGQTVWFLLGAAIPVTPWLLRNLLLVGDPVYPFAAAAFGVKGGLLGVATRFVESHQPNLSLGSLVRIPWDFFIHEGRFHFGSLGPYLLCALPLLIVTRRWPRAIGNAFAWAVVLTLLWAVTSQQMRYLFAAFPLWALCAGWALTNVARTFRWAAIVGTAVVALHDFTTFDRLAVTARFYFDPGPVLTGMESRVEYLVNARLPTTNYYEAIVADDGQGPGKMLLVGESRGFYAPRLWIGGTADDGQWLADVLLRCVNESSLANELRRAGVVSILVNRPEEQRLEKEYSYFVRPGSRELWEGFLKNRCTLLKAGRGAELWKVGRAN